MLTRQHAKFFGISQRSIALLTLLGICSLTFPLPTGQQDARIKDAPTPFPCQHSACGCRTAEQCWMSCCCNSPEQRLAWAKKNDVTPPSYAVVASENDETSKSRTCCKHGKKPAFSDTDSGTKDTRKKRRLIIGSLVLKCHGQSSELSSMPWVIVDADWRGEPLNLQVERLVLLRSLPPAAIYFDLDDPPPRTAV